MVRREPVQERVQAALFIDGTTADDHAVGTTLRRLGFAIIEVDDVRTALEVGSGRRFDLVIVGLLLSATPALDDLMDALQRCLRCPVVSIKAARRRPDGGMIDQQTLCRDVAEAVLRENMRRGRRVLRSRGM